jgi:hypothetical protein
VVLDLSLSTPDGPRAAVLSNDSTAALLLDLSGDDQLLTIGFEVGVLGLGRRTWGRSPGCQASQADSFGRVCEELSVAPGAAVWPR